MAGEDRRSVGPSTRHLRDGHAPARGDRYGTAGDFAHAWGSDRGDAAQRCEASRVSARDEALQRLEVLKGNYGAQLPMRLDEIGQAWDATAPEPIAVLSVLVSLAHKLAGTAGVFGFNTVSRAAAALEAAAERQIHIGVMDAAAKAEITRLIAD